MSCQCQAFHCDVIIAVPRPIANSVFCRPEDDRIRMPSDGAHFEIQKLPFLTQE